MTDKKYFSFDKHMYLIGFGSIGEGVLPLILRHIGIRPEQIEIITADERGSDEAMKYGIKRTNAPLTRDNYRKLLAGLNPGDFVVNVSVDVSCGALIELCQEKGAFYIDTVVEPWLGFYTDPNLTATERSNYALRESALKLKQKYPGGPTAVICHGANPGLVSHFVKQGLLNMARDTGLKTKPPTTAEGWAGLAQQLDIKAIHIAERDTQVSAQPKKPGEFVNTWSIEGFYSEGCQPAELGWGTHEKALPPDGITHASGCGAAIFLNRPGCTTYVRSWTPLEGPYQGLLITHNEAISLADYMTLRDGDKVTYRPTCHYAYHPCDDAILSVHELNGKNQKLQDTKRLMMDEITSGMDELGVLLMGNKKGVYWYGSRLTIDQARKLAPYNNATSLQVTVALLSGMVWAVENPKAGVVEPEEIGFERILEIAKPYLGDLVGVWGDWSPLTGRAKLFPEDLDRDDPWQFKNIRVV